MTPLELAISNAAGVTRLACAINVKYQSIQNWIVSGRPPAEHVLSIEKATGVPRYELRPDIYPPEEYKQAS